MRQTGSTASIQMDQTTISIMHKVSLSFRYHYHFRLLWAPCGSRPSSLKWYKV